MKNLLKVGFVILSYKNVIDTVECIESLRNIKGNFDIKIYLVDNSDNEDFLKDILNKVNVDFFKKVENNGYSSGNNIGMQTAYEDGCQYIVVINNDTVVEPNFLKPMIDFMENNIDVGAVSPVILTFKGEKIWCSGGVYRKLLGNYSMTRKTIDEPTRAEFISGCCLCIRRSTLEKVGYFDETYFMYNEDSDWCFRLTKAKFKMFVIPESIIYHKVSLSSGINSPFQLYYIFRNRLVFIYKNFNGLKKLIYLFLNYFITFAKSLKYRICRDKNRSDALNYSMIDAKNNLGRYRY